jgi:SAM-dependent methyltransferase
MADCLEWYAAHADRLAASYEGIAFEDVHGWLLDLLPPRPARVLDVGAGSGRDAAWLAAQGFVVVALEPCPALRSLAKTLHPDERILWRDDSLPLLTRTTGPGFDCILVSAVWMHLHPPERPAAFQRLIDLLNPGGVLVMTLRHGPAEYERKMYPVSSVEIEELARTHSVVVERIATEKDRLGREDVTWTQVAIRALEGSSERSGDAERSHYSPAETRWRRERQG